MGGTDLKWGGRAPLAPPQATALIKLCEASFPDSEKIVIWYKFLLFLDRVFSELFGTNFNQFLVTDFFKILKLV